MNYNESKVQQGKAICLSAKGYLREAAEMNFYQKLAGLENLIQLNDRAETKTLHVSLNFDPSEKLPESKLIEIANQYMNRIGFGEQPFLVYKHEDAGHPHIHIVSATIKADGSRINTHNIGRNQSEKARKELEQQFGLRVAGRQPQKTGTAAKVIDAEKALYGKHETRKAISDIVGVIFYGYNFTSLPEYNAALRQFNVLADRGKEDGRIYKNGGLVYRLLDGDGHKIGVPIKASSLSGQPTLKALEKRFAVNEPAREPLKQALKQKLDDCLSTCRTVRQLTETLNKQKVFTLLRQNAEGRIYGITYVDNASKCVFNGSSLGKGYSAAAVQRRLAATPVEKAINLDDITKQGSSGGNGPDKSLKSQEQKLKIIEAKKESLLNMLFSAKEEYAGVPAGLLKKKRKKKKRDSNF